MERATASMEQNEAKKDNMKRIEKEAIRAFTTNVEYFEFGLAHHELAGEFEANVEEDVKSLILGNLHGNVLDAGGVGFNQCLDGEKQSGCTCLLCRYICNRC